MCGIIVMISTGDPIDRGSFERARDSMVHRGPDAAGSAFLQDGRVALGHRRLSILDLSEAGNQPMQLGSIWVTFNGEIYNYPDLKRELEGLGCKFNTHSDTEVLLHGYKTWGKNLCDHLSGMFAFAIWDEEKRRLFVGRDHIGQKPLYYAQVDDGFIAASEIKAIKILKGKKAFSVRSESIIDHIIYDHVPEPYTWYEGIKCVSPGHQLITQVAGDVVSCMEEKYWKFVPPVEPWELTTEEALERMGQEIEKAIQSHLLSDVEVGAFLSGGVDSSCVVSLASQYLNHPIRTFSVGFGAADGDELPLARETALQVGATHNESTVSEADYQASLDKILEMFDQPFADSSLVPTERVSALAAKDVKVVLTGDGGDEAFGGYNLGKYISPALDRDIWRNLSITRAGLRSLQKYLYQVLSYHVLGEERWRGRDYYPRYRESTEKQRRLFGAELAERLEGYDHKWVYEENIVPSLDPFRQAQWHHLKFILPGKMLAKVDRCSMRHSVEARAPFLSHKLVETMLSMPTEIRNPRKNWYKGLFRQWAQTKIPRSVTNAPKRGFGAPVHWNPITSRKRGKEALQHCIDAGFISLSAWPEIKSKPRLFWKLLQVERALEEGMF